MIVLPPSTETAMSLSRCIGFWAIALPASLLSLLVAAPPVLAASDVDFSGNWTAWICPKGEASSQPDPARCSSFVLSLYQKENKLCGSHLFATAGATQLDEGDAPSISASIEKDGARGTVESRRGATPVQLHVDFKVSDNVLTWQRTDNPGGDYMLPRAARLRRAAKGNLFGAEFAQRLSAVCASALAVATTAAPPAAPSGQDAAVRAGTGPQPLAPNPTVEVK
ncbi:MAG: hypothetical protein JWR21_2425 [Herminiimonas sp.]|nr:hypothetical protein [Herminiimonas sp.]